MTKAEQARVVAWRLKILQYGNGEPRQVARTCRHFGISRTLFYRWKRRFEAYGEAGLADRPRTPLRSPRATPPAVVSKILYLRQQYHFGPGRIADYLKRFHQVPIACTACAGCRPTRGTSPTANAGSVTKSRSRGTACRWT